ncbi:MAG: chromosome segregation protein SMC [Desulfobacterales bacterium]|jgi:chromosome segregation protein
MKLKRLEITGFKSFSEKADIQFPQGVSAIVGPNGCGKSNIVDALRWVMGEQSVKQLRGKSMEDVIFAGTSGKPPLNMAEVTLTLANDNGSAPEELKDFTEIMLTRRLFRSGESAYLMNKQPCRLKDIHNVFLGSGLGTKSYSIIQQGNIGAIIDAGPEERRYFIEEAAGTTRYKNRKTEALRKVESTRQNLLRVSDIISEIHRQMAGLKRQARKAERFKQYQRRADALDIHLSLYNYERLSRHYDETGRLLQELKDSDLGNTSQLKKLDAAVEEIKLQRSQKNQEIADQKSRKFELLRKIDRIEGDLSHQRQEIERLTDEAKELQAAREDLEGKNRKIDYEIDEAQGDTSRLRTEIDTLRQDLHREQAAAAEIKTRIEDLNADLETSKTALMDRLTEEARYRNIFQNAANNKESLQRRLKRAGEGAAVARQRVAQGRTTEEKSKADWVRLTQQATTLDEELERIRRLTDEKREILARQVKQVQTLELERSTARSKFSTLKKMEENFEWYRDGVKAIMRAPEFGCTPGCVSTDDPMADTDVTAEGNKEIVGLLADILDPSPEYQAAVEAVLGEALQYVLVDAPQTGVRAIEYLQSHGAGRSGFIPVAALMRIEEDRRPAQEDSDRLLKHVAVKTGYERIAEAFLGHVVVAEDIHAGLALFNGSRRHTTIVTKQGDVISRQGLMIGGSMDKLPGILAKKQEIKALEQQIRLCEQTLAEARERQQASETDVRKIETELQQLYEQKKSVDAEAVEAEKALYRASEELKHAVRHLEIVELEHEQLLGEESDIDDEMTRYHTALAQLTSAITAAREEVAEKTRQAGAVSGELEAFSQKIVDLKLSLTALNARLDNSNNTLRRLREFQEDGAARLISLAEDITLKSRRAATSKNTVTEYETNLAGMYEELKHLEEALGANESAYSAIDAQLRDNDGIIAELQDQRDKILEKTRLLEIEQTQRQVHRDTVVQRLEEHYHKPFAEYGAELVALREQLQAAEGAEMPTGAEEEELTRLREKISRIGDVNLAAINEYEQLKSRHDFLFEQREDLQKAIDDLHKVIRKINRITQLRFMETFDQVNQKLGDVFPRLFEGGSAKLVLTEPDNPLETGVEFMIHPPGKKLTRMSLLSGGEKALSAIAFIFSLFLIRPASFCLMDEIDAPLDDANVFRFNNLLKLIGEKSQIVMVTHNKKSMEFADMLFGITMEAKGVSKVVSVNLDR